MKHDHREIISISLERDDFVTLVLVHDDGRVSLLARPDALCTPPDRFEDACSIMATFVDGSIRVLKSHGMWQL